jgi:hypothetical protein
LRCPAAFLFRQMGTFNTAKMQDLRNLNSDGPTVEELANAPFPVLLLAGDKDAVLSPATVRRAGELLPSARVEVVAGAPHSMYWETPQLFNDAVALPQGGRGSVGRAAQPGGRGGSAVHQREDAPAQVLAPVPDMTRAT